MENIKPSETQHPVDTSESDLLIIVIFLEALTQNRNLWAVFQKNNGKKNTL
jgi:hypothetical protein